MRVHKTGRIGTARYPIVLAMIAQGLHAGEIGSALDVDAETVRKFARKRKLTIQRQPMTMELHPMWRDGTVKDRTGYTLTRVRRDGPHGYLIRALGEGRASGYAPLHRIVASQTLGRRLRPGEVVDHIDGDIANNDPSNLRVFASNADHLRVTLKGRCPNWTPEGRARMRGRPVKIRFEPLSPEAIANHSRIDDKASP